MKRSSTIDNDTSQHDKIKDFVVKQMKSCEVIEEKKKYLQIKLGETTNEVDKAHYQEQFRDLDEQYCRIGRNIKKVIEGRLMNTNDFEPVIHEILEYVSAQNQIKARIIYDENKILLEDSAYQSVKWFTIEDISHNIHFLSIKEEASVRLEMQKEYHYFKIHYQVDTSTGENICLPMSIEPSHLHMSDYYINFNKMESTIRDISNNQFGNVKFKVS